SDGRGPGGPRPPPPSPPRAGRGRPRPGRRPPSATRTAAPAPAWGKRMAIRPAKANAVDWNLSRDGDVELGSVRSAGVERARTVPRDRFGREINYLRISLIDHCNLRCVYCMPLRGLSFVPSPELLTAAEIETATRTAVQAGFRKFRLTGGEPTLRPEIVEIVRRIASTPGVQDVAMTTNAVLLPRLAAPLKAAGLGRINIHVDTFHPERLKKLMRF